MGGIINQIANPAVAQVPNGLETYYRLSLLRQAQQEAVLRQQQLQAQTGEAQARSQGLELQNQATQIRLKDEAEMNRAYVGAGGDPDAFPKNLHDSNYDISFGSRMQATQGMYQTKESLLHLTDEQRKQAQFVTDELNKGWDQINSAPSAQRPQVYGQVMSNLQREGIDTSKYPPQYPGDEVMEHVGLGLKTSTQLLAEATQRSEQQKNIAEAGAASAAEAQREKETQQLGQVTPAIRYEQQQENYRASLARQTQFANQQQNQGLQALQKQGEAFGGFLSTANTLKQSLAAAQNGNEMAAAVAPLQGTLFITTTEGVKRINSTELSNIAGAGSLVQRINGALGKQTGKGPLSDQLKQDMSKLLDLYTQSKYNSYKQQADYIQRLHGLDPTKTPVLAPDGSITYGGQAQPAPSTVSAAPSTSSATPQTHVFSVGAWLQKNPGGDANAAKAAAKAQGYQVVP